MGEVIFIAIFLVTSVIDLIVAVLTFRSHDKDSRPLGVALLAGAAVGLFYLGSVYLPDHFAMSLFSSCYFSCVSIALIAFSAFVTNISKVKPTKAMQAIFFFFSLYIFVDVAGLLLSPFLGDFALSFNEITPGSGLYSYDAHPFYWCHLAYCYLMVAYNIILLIYKSVKSPTMYRTRYVVVLSGFAIIIILNAVYLFLPSASFYDYSILLYSIMGLYIYVMHFYYIDHAILGQARELVLNQLGHGVVVFDAEGHFITLNPPAEFLLKEEKRNSNLTLDEFIDIVAIRRHMVDHYENKSFFWNAVRQGKRISYRVDYHILLDLENNQVGSVFVFSDNSLEVDILTGFVNHQAAMRSLVIESRVFERPCSLMACDIERLSYINETYGRDVGDEALALLADTMRNVAPANARFVRYSDATLMAIMPGVSEQRAHTFATEIDNRMAAQTTCPAQLVVQNCVEVLHTRERIEAAVRRTMGGLRSRKLLVENSSHSSLISSLAQMQRQGDGETEEHVQRTRDMGELLGHRLGLSDSEINDFALLCLLHDIGKVGVPLEILNKPGRLTSAEWSVMKSHTTKGYTIAMASEELHGVAEYILHHHENWDGSGYPDGLSGEAIPLLSRIVSVVDTFDAMTHNRPYRRAISIDEAKSELRRCAGTQFDPTIVAEFLAMIEERPELAVSEWVDDRSDPMTALRDEMSSVGTSENGNVEAAITSNEAEADFAAPGYDAPANTPERHFYAEVQNYARYQLDENGRIVDINEEFTNLTGYTVEDLDVYKLTQNDLIPQQDQAEYWAKVSAGLKAEHAVMLEHHLLTKTGIVLHVMCYGREYFDAVNKTGRSEIIAADLSRTKMSQELIQEARTRSDRAQQRWENALRKDGTGVLTRPAFRNDVQLLLMDESRIVLLMMMDVDKFKTYNDTKGHPQGDALLNRMAQLLMETSGDDGFAGRFGGDEFAVAKVFPRGTSREKLEEATALTWQYVNDGLMEYDNVHISLGAATESSDNITFSSLYARTDDALYAAKEAGRACYRVNFDEE